MIIDDDDDDDDEDELHFLEKYVPRVLFESTFMSSFKEFKQALSYLPCSLTVALTPICVRSTTICPVNFINSCTLKGKLKIICLIGEALAVMLLHLLYM